jgi:hypothetical protein
MKKHFSQPSNMIKIKFDYPFYKEIFNSMSGSRDMKQFGKKSLTSLMKNILVLCSLTLDPLTRLTSSFLTYLSSLLPHLSNPVS